MPELNFRQLFSHPAFIPIILFFAYLLSFGILSPNSKHYPYGDGPEYVLMTESFYQHFSPDLQPIDGKGYLNYLEEKNLEVYRRDEFERAASDLSKTLNPTGYVKANNGKWYCYHFWFYSLINLPARTVLSALNLDIRATFLATNLALLFLALWLISGFKNLNWNHRLILGLMLISSPLFWYLDWAHPEVFIGTMVFLAILYFFNQKYYASLLLLSLSSMQHTPLAVPAFALVLFILYREKIKLKTIGLLFLGGFWVLVPLLFYYFHFGVFSLLKEYGDLSSDLISIRRFYDFIFDLNQGMIVGIPAYLILLLGLITKDIIQRNWRPEYLLLLFIGLMSLFFMQLQNWNSGSVFVKRYVIYNAPFVMLVLFYRLKKLRPILFQVIFAGLLISQFILVFGQARFNQVFWTSGDLNGLSRLVLNHFPSLYNPDPQVFARRVSPLELSSTDSVMTYTNSENQIVKMMVKQGSISQLQQRGVDPEKISALDSRLNYYIGYAYLNPADLEFLGYKQEDDPFIAKIEAGKEAVNKEKIRQDLLQNSDWYQKVKAQAEELSITVDSCVQLNVDYVYEQNLTKQKEE